MLHGNSPKMDVTVVCNLVVAFIVESNVTMEELWLPEGHSGQALDSLIRAGPVSADLPVHGRPSQGWTPHAHWRGRSYAEKSQERKAQS